MSDNNCAICWETISESDIIKLECTHLFHKDCSLFLNNDLCPLCRMGSIILKNHIVTPMDKLRELSNIINDTHESIILDDNINYFGAINKINELCSKRLYIIDEIRGSLKDTSLIEIQMQFSTLIELLILYGTDETDDNDISNIFTMLDIMKSISQKIELYYIEKTFVHDDEEDLNNNVEEDLNNNVEEDLNNNVDDTNQSS